MHYIPNQLRWSPFKVDNELDWPNSIHLVAGAGDVTLKQGFGIMVFVMGKSMDPNEAFSSADGDFLIVLQQGILDIQTEFGHLLIRPNEICVIPRGIRYRVMLPQSYARGYILELYEGHFRLPELGPIGSQSLANARDFQAPTAAYDHDTSKEWQHITKFNNNFFVAKQDHTPFDVVAWHGSYYPYKYDLGRFNTIGSISYDHPDPSIFTVLTAPSAHVGTAITDFVIFPPRWLVAEDTYRPPEFHRNVMSEFMGLIHGEYDGKVGGGFQPFGASLHNIMSAHGPDSETHQKATAEILQPRKVGGGSMAFMFESYYMIGISEWGLNECSAIQDDYIIQSWKGLKPSFTPLKDVENYRESSDI
ncbi:homogentisate 1,2-dioxygenase [Xylogone sp. PMI_703]|nr:homogentisate 1,2-dioxygenase [Xylogone sp. PMI_703]